MGVVYLALDPSLERRVALKTLNIRLAGDKASRRRFLREARVAGSISHPNVVTIHELGEEDGNVFIAMEYLEGEDLEQKIKRGVEMSLEEKIGIVTDICRGLAHAHSKNATHRDIKPGNIFICDTGEAIILDFGLAHLATSTLTKLGQMVGTPRYMAPEQITQATAIDARTDIFSLGAVMYELLTCEKAFAGKTVDELIMQVVYEQPEPLDHVDPSLPTELAAIVAKAYEKKPEDRYQNAGALHDDLARFLHALCTERERIHEEARAAIEELEGFVGESRTFSTDVAAPKDAAEKRLSFLREALARDDLSAAELGDLRDEAKEGSWRLGTFVVRAKRELPPGEVHGHAAPPYVQMESVSRKAAGLQTDRMPTESPDAMFRQAAVEFSRGELAACLQMLSMALRQDPRHADSNALAERLRLAIIERVEQWDKQHAQVAVEASKDQDKSRDLKP